MTFNKIFLTWQWWPPEIPVAQDAEVGGPLIQSQPQELYKVQSKLIRPWLKIKCKNGHGMNWGCNSVVEFLPSIGQTLYSIIKTTKILNKIKVNFLNILWYLWKKWGLGMWHSGETFLHSIISIKTYIFISVSICSLWHIHTCAE